MFALCLCLKNLPEAKLKSFRLMAEKISRQPSEDCTIPWLLKPQAATLESRDSSVGLPYFQTTNVHSSREGANTI